MSHFAIKETTFFDLSRSWSGPCRRRLFTDVKIS